MLLVMIILLEAFLLHIYHAFYHISVEVFNKRTEFFAYYRLIKYNHFL